MFTASSTLDPDAAIRSTDDDAAHARISAVRKGYLDDPFITALVPRAHLVPSRPPLINIGTFIRSISIDRLIEGWILSQGNDSYFQIISLGAGSDSRFWRLRASADPLIIWGIVTKQLFLFSHLLSEPKW
jgi:O-methyltransferase involved in polyketide biosynthesis